jgi:excisionase family DNA binding protein
LGGFDCSFLPIFETNLQTIVQFLMDLTMSIESLSVAEASDKLGVSIPTVKAMYRRGELDGFLTPGRHLRISSESLESFRAHGRSRTTAVSAPSTTLQARRERIEFLNLEGEELRARRELDRLRAEGAAEEEERASQEHAEDLEREQRLENARAERLRQERLQQDAATERRRAALREQVQLALSVTVPVELSAEKQRELSDQLEAELRRANVEDPELAIPIIKAVCERFRVSLLREKRDQGRRERIVESARSEIATTCGSTENDEAEAVAAARTALSSLSSDIPETEMRCAVKAAIAPVRSKVEQRESEKRLDIQRRRRRQETIDSAVEEVEPYLERLKRAAAGIEFDFSFVSRLKDVVRARLAAELTNQNAGELRRLVHETIDSEIE